MRAYRELIRAPGVLNVTAAQLFARLPLGMLSLAILLHVRECTGSYALAGAVVACVSVGEAIAMPTTARLAGRWGRSTVLVCCASVSGAGMLGLALAGSSPPVLLILGLLIGASVPPLMPVVRSLYPHMVPRNGVRALFALDTTAQELIWVVGPVAATLLASTVSTALPLVASAAVTVGGTVWFLLGARRIRPGIQPDTARFGRVLLDRAVLLAMVASLALMASFMALEVGVVAAYGDAGIAAGVAIAVASVGSLIGGVVFGHRPLGLPGVVIALLVVAFGTAAYGLVANPAAQLVALFVSGLGFAPSLAALYVMVSRSVDERQAAEAFGWLSSAALVGAAIGTAVAGVATDVRGAAGAIVVSVGFAVAAACSPLVARTSGPLPGLAPETPVEPVTSTRRPV